MSRKPTAFRRTVALLVGLSGLAGPTLVVGSPRAALGAVSPKEEASRPSAPPAVRISVAANGASAHQLEERVINPLEQAVAGLKGVASVRSEIRTGWAVVTIYFRPDYELRWAVQDVQEAVNAARRDLPEHLEPPLVTRGDGARAPILGLALFRLDADALGRMISTAQDMQSELARTRGLRGVELLGAKPRLYVRLDLDKLAAFGLDPADVAAALREQNYSLAPDFNLGLRGVLVLKDGETDQKGLEKLVLRSGSHENSLSLGDLATVRFGAPEQARPVHCNGARVLLLAAHADSEDAAAVRDAVLTQLPQLRKQIPDGMKIEPVLDPAGGVGETFLLEVRLPVRLKAARADEMLDRIEDLIVRVPDVKDVLAIPDEDALGSRMYVHVKDAGEKAEAERQAIRKRLAEETPAAVGRILDVRYQHLPPERRAPVALILQNEDGEELKDLAERLQRTLANSPRLVDVWSDAAPTVPIVRFDMDPKRVAALHITSQHVFDALGFGGGLGPSSYAIEAPERLYSDPLPRFQIRTGEGRMAPLDSLASVRHGESATQIDHFECRRAVLLSAAPMPGATLDEARQTCREAVRKADLPRGCHVLLAGAEMETCEDLTPQP